MQESIKVDRASGWKKGNALGILVIAQIAYSTDGIKIEWMLRIESEDD